MFKKTSSKTLFKCGMTTEPTHTPGILSMEIPFTSSIAREKELNKLTIQINICLSWKKLSLSMKTENFVSQATLDTLWDIEHPPA